MKDNGQLFKKCVRKSSARGQMEVLGVDESGGHVSDHACMGGSKRVGVKKAESKRQILLVKRKGNIAGQNR